MEGTLRAFYGGGERDRKPNFSANTKEYT